MSPHLSPLADVLTWTGIGAYLLLTGFLIIGGVRGTRRHEARLRGYEEARRAADAEADWQGVRRMLDGDPPPEYDPLIVSDPKTPQRGESG